jgi:hypothetical protein
LVNHGLRLDLEAEGVASECILGDGAEADLNGLGSFVRVVILVLLENAVEVQRAPHVLPLAGLHAPLKPALARHLGVEFARLGLEAVGVVGCTLLAAFCAHEAEGEALAEVGLWLRLSCRAQRRISLGHR